MGDVRGWLVRSRARLADLSAKARRATAEALVRRRVALGFVAGAVVLVVADPTWPWWLAGLVVAMAGECIRVWAAGHLEKSREVTRSGPYRLTRHPLYVGSGVMAIGAVIASRSSVVAVIAAIYVATTIPAASRAEERFLRRTFGDVYDRYRQSQSPAMERRFSFERAWRNREYRAIAGLIGGFALLALKILLPI
jgi:protein-S-isoprenylcysteine O-methyltransferase Ste14